MATKLYKGLAYSIEVYCIWLGASCVTREFTQPIPIIPYQEFDLLLLLPVGGVAADEDDEKDKEDEEDDAGDEERVVHHVVQRGGAPRVEEEVAHRAVNLMQIIV